MHSKKEATQMTPNEKFNFITKLYGEELNGLVP
jgi:hypothetical protein